MIKSKFLFILLSVSAIALTSCETTKNYVDHLDDYAFSMKYHDNFNILQLTDIHWNANTSTLKSKQYLEKVLKEAHDHTGGHIDLVELTGDQFMLSNSYHVKSFIKFFEEKAEEYGFKYAVIWGNHDQQGLYNPNWLGDQFKKAKNCFYAEPNDNLYGRSNFVINLTVSGDRAATLNPTVWQIVNLDSGASFSETAISPFRDYDYIRKDQTDWWLKEHEAAGADVPTIAYYHIPQDENDTMWKAVTENGAPNKNKFFKLEEFASNESPDYASDFIDVGIKNNMKGAFMGHAHNVDWTVEMEDADTGNKLLLGLGVKSGIELYYAHIDTSSDDPAMKKGLESVGINENFDLIGASLVTITDEVDNIEGKFDLEHLYLNERASGDFVRWVKW